MDTEKISFFLPSSKLTLSNKKRKNTIVREIKNKQNIYEKSAPGTDSTPDEIKLNVKKSNCEKSRSRRLCLCE